MTEFTDWLQNNVIDVARLLMECVILVTVVRFSRTLLRTLRASQEQLGALLRLSVSDGASQQTTSGPSSMSEAFSEPPMHDAQGDSEGAAAFTSERTFAPVAPAPMYSSSSVLGAINGSDRGGSDHGGADRGRFESEGFSAREHSLGGRVMEEADSAVAVAEPPAATPWVDRKSTRLNSSHLVISYAVFCLKKKKHSHRSNTAARSAYPFQRYRMCRQQKPGGKPTCRTAARVKDTGRPCDVCHSFMGCRGRE